MHNRREDVRLLFASLCELILPLSPLKEASPSTSLSTHERLTRSYLLDRVEDFMVWKYHDQHKRKEVIDIDLLKSYKERGLTYHLGNRLKRQRQQLRKHPRYDGEGLYAAFQLEEFYQEQHLDQTRRIAADFHRTEYYLLRAQTVTALRRAALNLAGARFSEQAPELPLLEEYLAVVEQQSELQKEPGILLYYNLCRYALPNPPVTLLPLAELTSLLDHYLDGFSSEDQVDLLKLLLNQAIRRLNQRTSKSNLRDAFDLYRLGIEKELLLHQKRITVFTFNNIMGIALRLEEKEFAATFLENYQTYLPPATAQEVISLNGARLAYARGELSEALFLLQGADYRDNVHLMSARTLQIKIYYESGEHEALRDLIRATRTLIRRRRDIGYHRQVYRNNLRMIQRLVNLNWPKPTAVDKFKSEVLALEPLTERDWLLKQLTTN
ncbi:MAG: hypothetical protein AAFU67_04335 [Bacteroidota bacterium]